MYEVVIQEGIVLARRPRREADVAVELLTPSGLLRASARSARVEQSKLRYGLEVLTRARYSLVRGRQWRLTGVTDIDRRYLAPCLPAGRAAMGRVSRLLLRLVAGVDPSPALYQVVAEGFDALSTQLPSEKVLGSPVPASTRPGRPDHFLQEVSSLETVLVLRILSNLGYLPHSEALAPFIEGGFDIGLSAKALEAKALLVRTINESLRATGL
jgi:hypothetical protein